MQESESSIKIIQKVLLFIALIPGSLFFQLATGAQDSVTPKMGNEKKGKADRSALSKEKRLSQCSPEEIRQRRRQLVKRAAEFIHRTPKVSEKALPERRRNDYVSLLREKAEYICTFIGGPATSIDIVLDKNGSVKNAEIIFPSQRTLKGLKKLTLLKATNFGKPPSELNIENTKVHLYF